MKQFFKKLYTVITNKTTIVLLIGAILGQISMMPILYSEKLEANGALVDQTIMFQVEYCENNMQFDGKYKGPIANKKEQCEALYALPIVMHYIKLTGGKRPNTEYLNDVINRLLKKYANE